MNADTLKNDISRIQQYFSGQPVKRAWLFGSYSRGEERTDSDVDILVEYSDSKRMSLFAISRMTCALQNLINKRVDLVEADCLLPFAAEGVEHDKVLIYERAN